MFAWSRPVGWLACGLVLLAAPLQRIGAQSVSTARVPSETEFNQPAAYDPPPGTVLPYGGTSIMRDGAFVPVTSDIPLITGDRLRTAAGGSALIVLFDHSVIFLSEPHGAGSARASWTRG
jgi:hypothetical protein